MVSKIGSSALIIGSVSLLAFLTILAVYCFVHKREKKKRKGRIFPDEEICRDEKSNESKLKKESKSSGIGQVETNIIAPAAYDNKGLVLDDYDNDF